MRKTIEPYKMFYVLLIVELMREAVIKQGYLERAHEGLVHAHHAPGVVKLPAVVGSREQGHQLALGKELVAVLHHLRGEGRRTFKNAGKYRRSVEWDTQIT